MYFAKFALGQYIPTGSFIHILDPRAKLFSLLFIITSVFPAENIYELGTWTALLFALVHASKISWPALLRSARPVMFLVIFTFAFNTIAGSFTDEFINAFTNALFMSSRLFVLMLFAVMLPLTTTALELADGLDVLLRPLERFHFPAHESSMMIAMALRFIPLLMQETDKIIRAQVSRGARLDQGNIFKRAVSFVPVLIPLFIIIFRRADEIAVAMEARGYNGGEGRTRRKPLVWKFRDTCAVILSGTIAGVLLFVI